MEIKKVGVLGCGLMGAGIAQVAASAGFKTVVKEISDELIAKGFGGIEKSLAKFAEKYGHEFHRIEALTQVDDTMRVLDMKREAVRENVLVGNQSALELYESSLAVDYDPKRR